MGQKPGGPIGGTLGSAQEQLGILASHLHTIFGPLRNREILNVDRATPAVSLNRSRPNLVQIRTSILPSYSYADP